MRDAYPQFEAAGVKLYAVSYDDTEALRAFTEGQSIPYPLLSDIDSEVIRRYGILNDQVKPGDAMLYGIPYPGAFVCDEGGLIIARFFHDSYKKRDSAETLLHAALGQVKVDDAGPQASTLEDTIGISLQIRGGGGRIRQGMIRHLVVRFDIPEGLHIYGAPAPEGMQALSIRVDGPDGLIIEPMNAPATAPLHLASMELDLNVWQGTPEFIIPLYANGVLASEVRPLDQETIELTVTASYQACDDATCLLPTTQTLHLTAPLDVVDIPQLAIHQGHGQREGNYDATPHMRRLLKRKIKKTPFKFLKFIWRSLRLERAGKARRGQKD